MSDQHHHTPAHGPKLPIVKLDDSVTRGETSGRPYWRRFLGKPAKPARHAAPSTPTTRAAS